MITSRAFLITEETYPLAVALLPSEFQDKPLDLVLNDVVIFHELPGEAPIDNRWMSLEDFQRKYNLDADDVVSIEMFRLH